MHECENCEDLFYCSLACERKECPEPADSVLSLCPDCTAKE